VTFNVGIFLYPEVEVLDFAGPYEVFTTATRVDARNQLSTAPIFNVFSIADVDPLVSTEARASVQARAGLKFVPDYSINKHPAIDLLIIPGGVVTRELQKPHIINWIRRVSETAKITASVCTGAFLLAKADVISNHTVTTHWEDIADLKHDFPRLTVIDDKRWVDEKNVVTSAGISAGIDMSLHVVARLINLPLAERTARQMEFDWVKNGLIIE
jgi:transcriptional regulator GlxA family with amidase domain